MQTVCMVTFQKKNCFWDLNHCLHHQSPSSLYHPLLNLRKLVGNPGVESSCTKVINKYMYVIIESTILLPDLKSWSFVILVSNTRTFYNHIFQRWCLLLLVHTGFVHRTINSQIILLCARGSKLKKSTISINWNAAYHCSLPADGLKLKHLSLLTKQIMIINNEIKLNTSNYTDDAVTMKNV